VGVGDPFGGLDGGSEKCPAVKPGGPKRARSDQQQKSGRERCIRRGPGGLVGLNQERRNGGGNPFTRRLLCYTSIKVWPLRKETEPTKVNDLRNKSNTVVGSRKRKTEVGKSSSIRVGGGRGRTGKGKQAGKKEGLMKSPRASRGEEDDQGNGFRRRKVSQLILSKRLGKTNRAKSPQGSLD